MTYIIEISPTTVKVCQPLGKIMPSKYEWKWNSTFQKLYDKARNILRKKQPWHSTIKEEHLYLETDALGVEIGANLLQARDRMQFQKKQSA